jgi:hypothetical protein
MESSPTFDAPPTDARMSPVHAPAVPAAGQRLARESAPPAPPAKSAAAPVPESEAEAAARPAAPAVSDALLEPELAAARDRPAGWAKAGIPVASLAILAVLLAAAWLF